MSGHAFRMDMGFLISVPAQSAPPSYTITHAHSFKFYGAYHQICPRVMDPTRWLMLPGAYELDALYHNDNLLMS